MAQPVNEAQHLPYQQLGNFTPYQQSVSENFLFLVDDDIQKVLFNPARAGELGNAFVSTVISPSERLDNFRLSVLTKSKWLFSFGGNFNQVNTTGDVEDSFLDASINEVGDLVSEYNRTIYNSRDFTDDRTESQADLSFSKIIRTPGGKNFSIGGFLGYSKVNRESDVISEQVQVEDRIVTAADTLQFSLQSNNEVDARSFNVTTTERITVGLSLHSYNNGIDSRHKIFIQKNSYTRETDEFTTQNAITDLDDYRDPEFRDTIFEREIERIFVNNVDPLQFRYSGYINKPVSWVTDKDYLFASIRALYSEGTSNQQQSFRSELMEATNGQVTRSEEDLDDYPAVEVDDRLWGGMISMGYMIKLDSDDLNFFTGINPYYGFSDYESFDIENFRGVGKDNFTQEAGAQIPIYTSYAITKYFNIWGGAKLNARYSRIKTKETTMPDLTDFENPELIFVVPQISTTTRGAFDYNQSLFLGFKLSHESGLSILNNFRSNLTSVNSWVVSLRYSF
jgi:hypothetical protein